MADDPCYPFLSGPLFVEAILVRSLCICLWRKTISELSSEIDIFFGSAWSDHFYVDMQTEYRIFGDKREYLAIIWDNFC